MNNAFQHVIQFADTIIRAYNKCLISRRSDRKAIMKMTIENTFPPLHSILHCSLHKSHDLYFLTIMPSLVVHPPFSRSNGSLYEKSPYICILLLSSQLYPVDVFILKEENCP